MAKIRCPTCDRLFETEKSPAMPFCSARCRQIDLGRWLKEEHSVPNERPLDEEEFDVFPVQRRDDDDE
jgi:uncharacterized protein